MPDGREALGARLIERIADIPAADWDACAGTDFPFVTHGFLHALETSGSVGERTGWVPRHLVVEDAGGQLVAAVPMYLKGHSYGEYVFDWGWADAWERAGGQYYPKLQASVPYTPVTGPRLLVRPGPDEAAFRDAAISGLLQVTDKLGVSSLHVTFPTAAEADRMEELGLVRRMGQQFHWFNRGYATFDDFLAELSSRKRKQIRRERREVADAGLSVRALTGGEIEARHWDAFFRFYVDTYDRKWGQPYLTRGFFQQIGETMADRIVLVMVEHDGVPVAGALNIQGAEALYGRNWGCAADFRFLHFETCYYQAIEFAILNGIQTVEAGTQGHHKLQRGYMPVPTWSAHYIPDAGFRRAVADFCEHERRAIEQEMEALAKHSPYRQDGNSSTGERG